MNSSRRNSFRRISAASAAQRELQAYDTRVVLYIRASTSDQKHTLEAQAHDAAAFAQANGKEIAATFIDSGVSGSKPFLLRPEARKAVAHLRKHAIGTLLVMRLDRAFRNTVDMHQTIDHLMDLGITFRIANPDIDFKGPFGRLIATLLGAMAEFELGCRSERQQKGYDSMRRQRIARSQNAPYGWDIGGEHPTERSKSGKPYRLLVPNPAEQAVLREITGLYDQRLTLQEIADILNQRGIRTKQAGQTLHHKEKRAVDPKTGGEKVVRKAKTITVSGEWKPAIIQSVLAHAEIEPVPNTQ